MIAVVLGSETPSASKPARIPFMTCTLSATPLATTACDTPFKAAFEKVGYIVHRGGFSCVRAYGMAFDVWRNRASMTS